MKTTLGAYADPSNRSFNKPLSTASQSTLPLLEYTLSYDDTLMFEKNGTRSRKLSICRTWFSEGRRMGFATCPPLWEVVRPGVAGSLPFWIEGYSKRDVKGVPVRKRSGVGRTAEGRLPAISASWSSIALGVHWSGGYTASTVSVMNIHWYLPGTAL